MINIGSIETSAQAGIYIDNLIFNKNLNNPPEPLKKKDRINYFPIITSVTFQGKEETNITNLSNKIILSQLEFAFNNIGNYSKYNIIYIKIGFLGNRRIIDLIYKYLLNKKIYYNLFILTDPVIKNSLGNYLLNKNDIKFYANKIFKISNIITPNINELRLITSKQLKDGKDVIQYSKNIIDNNKQLNIIVKSCYSKNKDKYYHLYINQEKYDKIYYSNITDGKNKNKDPRGTGCRFASYIIIFLYYGLTIEDAIQKSNQLMLDFVRNY